MEVGGGELSFALTHSSVAGAADDVPAASPHQRATFQSQAYLELRTETNICVGFL